jgi:hypothetical protein
LVLPTKEDKMFTLVAVALGVIGLVAFGTLVVLMVRADLREQKG